MRLRGAWRTFISSRTLQAANGAARPCLVGLQLRGVERLPREGVASPAPETEGASPPSQGKGLPDRHLDPPPRQVLGRGPGGMPYPDVQGPGPPLRLPPGRA